MSQHSTEIIADEDRCRRTDGKRWRCAFRRFDGSIYCPKHYQYYVNKNNNPKVRVSRNPRKNQGRVRVKMEPPSTEEQSAASGKKRSRLAKKKAAQEVPLVKLEGTYDGDEGVSDVRVSEATAKKKKGSQLLKNPEIPRRKRNPASVRVKRKPPSMDERRATSGKKRGRPSKKQAAEEVPLVKRVRTEDGGGEGVSGARVSKTTATKKRGRLAKNNAAQEVPLVKREIAEDGGERVSGVRVSESITKEKREKSFKKNPAQGKRTESGRGHGAYRVRVSKATDKKKRGRGMKRGAAQGVPVVVKKEGTENGGGEGVSGMKKNGEHNGIGDGEGVVRVMELSQIWAFPHDFDGYPRFYARIERFIPTLSLVQVTPLIPYPMTKHELKFSKQDFSLGCGMFRASDLMTVKDISSATHRAMASSVGDGGFFYKIFPKKGEVWAMYTWDDLTNDVEFKLVEVLSDFSEVNGIDVAALAQVERSENCGVYQLQVHEGFYMVRTFSSGYMPMFSHQVLASRSVKYGKKFWEVMFH